MSELLDPPPPLEPPLLEELPEEEELEREELLERELELEVFEDELDDFFVLVELPPLPLQLSLQSVSMNQQRSAPPAGDMLVDPFMAEKQIKSIQVH